MITIVMYYSIYAAVKYYIPQRCINLNRFVLSITDHMLLN